MKKIVIKSHILPSQQQIILPNGDKFDSIIELYNDDNRIINISICNVDSSNNRKDGKVEIKNGKYLGKCVVSQKLGQAILITDLKGNIELPSLYPNPRHQNKYVASSIMIHRTKAIYSDGSEGCITLHYSVFDDFMSNFELNEVVEIQKI